MDGRFFFDLKKASIYQAVKYSRNPLFLLAKPFRALFLAFFIITFFLFVYGFGGGNLSQDSNRIILGLSLIFLSLGVSFGLLTSFFNHKLKQPKLSFGINQALGKSGEVNLAQFLDFETAKAVFEADRFANSAKLPPTNSTALFHFLLERAKGLDFIFSRNLLSVQEIKNLLRQRMKEYEAKEAGRLGYTKDYEDTIWEALKIAQKRGHLRVVVGDVLSALAAHDPVFQKILSDNNLKKEDIENLSWWLESLTRRMEQQKRWWDYQSLMKRGTLGKQWTAGYTLTLDKYSTDWTELAKRAGFPEIIGHKEEVEQAERVLGRHEYNNVLLVGEPGVGRKAVIQGLVEKAVLGESLPDINYKRVVELSLMGLLTTLTDPEELEATLDKIFREAVEAGNVILVIDDFENFVGVKPGPGKIDISGVLAPYLSLPQFQVVAITSYGGLHKNIEQNATILNLFEKVEVAEIPEAEVMMVLENLALSLEQKYKVLISYPALRQAVSLTRRYMSSLPFPKKAVDLISEAVVYVKRTVGSRVILPEHIAQVIAQKTQVPVGEMATKEKEILLNLEKLIHQRLINQEEAVKDVSTALRRARAEVNVRKGPMGTFLFMGPTGVGKTETAKALSQIYFGSESRTIRLDMSEFQEVKDIARLIGGPGEEGLLTTTIRETPFSLILLDEIEKAHPNILNLFLQVLDEGSLTDGLGRKVDFKNAIIIATSNAGYQIILEALRTNASWPSVKQQLLDYIFDKAIFRPEFVNRFDGVVVFKPLSKANLLDIAELMLSALRKNLKEKGIDFTITNSLKEKIVELSYNPTFGAREMKRVIQDNVENALAQALLSDTLKRGDMVEVLPEDFSLKIKSV
jgi:ATP-dependent Clp protease ATP-binding subunit ClpC